MNETKKPTRRGFSVRLFLADGTPDGLKVVEKSNWTGRAVMCSRAQYPQVRQRQEFSGPGVYVLIGPSELGGGLQSIYVGEADVARERLDQHLKGKDFWTHLLVFSSKDENLNKAHVQYLESRLVDLALKAKRARVENSNVPKPPSLSEAERADAEAFLDDMLLLYPLLGVTAFEVAEEADKGSGPLLFLKGKECDATGKESAEGFFVLKGSRGRVSSVPSTHSYLVDLRKKLIEEGVLVTKDSHLVLTQDYRFDSPSTAAGVFLARSANGRIEWKDQEGRTLKYLQEAALSDAGGGVPHWPGSEA